jgi:hypothetical protein
LLQGFDRGDETLVPNRLKENMMSGKFGVTVLLLATAAWMVTESQAEAGRRHHRRGGCGSGCGYSAGCNTGCSTGCGTAAPCGGCETAVPVETAPQPPAPGSEAAPPAPPAPTPDAGANAPVEKPATIAAAPQRTYSYYPSRGRRWSRR